MSFPQNINNFLYNNISLKKEKNMKKTIFSLTLLIFSFTVCMQPEKRQSCSKLTVEDKIIYHGKHIAYLNELYPKLCKKKRLSATTIALLDNEIEYHIERLKYFTKLKKNPLGRYSAKLNSILAEQEKTLQNKNTQE